MSVKAGHGISDEKGAFSQPEETMSTRMEFLREAISQADGRHARAAAASSMGSGSNTSVTSTRVSALKPLNFDAAALLYAPT